MHWSANATPTLAWLGHTEVLIIAGVVVLMLFANRIPDVMRALGRGITQFRMGLKDSRGPDGERVQKPSAGGTAALPPSGEGGDAAPGGKKKPEADSKGPQS